MIEGVKKNEALKGDALTRKRAVYRAEEQIKALEQEKNEQDQVIAEYYEELKRLQDEETYLSRQAESQGSETAQAQEILQEAYRQIEVIKADIKTLDHRWQLVLLGIEKKSSQVRELQDVQISEAEGAKAALQNALQNCRKEILRVREEIQRVSDRAAQRQSLKDQAAAKYDDIVNTQMVKLQAKYAALEASLNAGNLALAELTDKLAKQRRENDHISAESDKSQRKLTALESEILTENAEQAAGSRELSSLLATAKKLREDIVAVEREIARSRNELAKRELDSITADAAIDSLRSAKDALQQEAAEKDRLVTSYEAQLTKNANAIEQRSSAITRLNRKLEEHLRANPHADNGPLEAVMQNLTREITVAAKDVRESQAIWLRIQGDLVAHENILRNDLAEITTMAKQKEVLLRQGKDLEYDIECAKLKVQAVLKETEQVHVDIQRMSAEIARKAQECDALNSSNFVTETETAGKFEALRKEVVALEQRLDALRSEKTKAASCLVEVEEQVQLWQRKISIQGELLDNVRRNLNSDGDGELAQLERANHQMGLQLAGLKHMQQDIVHQMEQAATLRESLTITGKARAVLSTTKKTAPTGLAVRREIDAVKAKVMQRSMENSTLKSKLEALVQRRTALERENDEARGVAERLMEEIRALEADDGVEGEGAEVGMGQSQEYQHA